MLSIILGILKYIVFLLLGILLLLLLIISITLFVPIRYKANGDINNSCVNIYAKVTWLLKILSIELEQKDKDTLMRIKIFGIDINQKKKKNKLRRKKTKNKKSRKDNTNKQRKNTLDHLEKETIDDHKESIKKEKINDKSMTKSMDVSRNKKKEASTKKNKHNKKKKAGKKTFRQKFKDLKAKIQALKEQKNKVIAFCTNEENKKSFKKVIKAFKKVLKKILPKQFRLYLKIGTGDPASTGYLLGILSLLYTFKNQDLLLEGDFDEKVIQGNVSIKGRIYIATFVIAIIKLALDKNLRKLALSKGFS
ncbi:DUF2953 family protein [Natranaerovirga hydrolytica]|uniref:DUF2953 family protein n=1 Tax=Natranaerovirga hydrolytica TaxID=680378 RepID=A0A4R1MZ19_9FIRM|nr:DUF2953 domain-containing protein [Natranaerovirga hydrolytica]TCK97850.1 DUF2953 family protein [Natranaerovirga hydrolytica]